MAPSALEQQCGTHFWTRPRHDARCSGDLTLQAAVPSPLVAVHLWLFLKLSEWCCCPLGASLQGAGCSPPPQISAGGLRILPALQHP